MTETRQRQIDPESLSRMNAAKVTSLQDIFVNCMKGKVALVSGGASGLGYMVGEPVVRSRRKGGHCFPWRGQGPESVRGF